MIVPPFASRSEILKNTAASLGITQIVTSSAITICGLITYRNSILDPHATMCLTLALLGSASHAIPFWLEEFRTNKTRLRLGICTAQSLVLLIGFLYRKNSLKKRADDESDDNVSRYEVALVVFMLMTVFWDLALFFGLFFMKEKPGYGIRITNVLIALLYINSHKFEIQAARLQHEYR